MQYLKISVLGLAAVAAVAVLSPFAASQTAPSYSFAPAAGFADLIEQVSPAVVHVGISGRVNRRGVPDFNFPPGSPFEEFFEQFRNQRPGDSDQDQPLRPLGIGSGFIISSDGYIVTNHHVVDKADEITVTLADGEEFEAELMGSDSKTDLALIKVKSNKSLPYVRWGDVDQSRVGDWVLAIGNPFGLGGTATTGIISAIGRDIRSGPYDDYLQVDAAINQGNSGGPLFNLAGEVIGINSAIYSPTGGSVGIGFSIPSDLAQNVINQLQDTGHVARGWLGVQIQSLSRDLAEGFGLEDDSGALISSIVPESPASKSDFEPGDIIIEFDGKQIEKMRDLPRIVAETNAGRTVDVEIIRDGKRKTVSVTIDPLEEDTTALARTAPDVHESDPLGAELASLTDELRQRYRIDEEADGVVVTSVSRGGLAAENGLAVGDVIQRIGRAAVEDPDDVTEALEDAMEDGRDTVVVLFSRGGSSSFVPFRLN